VANIRVKASASYDKVTVTTPVGSRTFTREWQFVPDHLVAAFKRSELEVQGEEEKAGAPVEPVREEWETLTEEERIQDAIKSAKKKRKRTRSRR